MELQLAIILVDNNSVHISFRTRAETETWNESSWTEVGDLNTVKKNEDCFTIALSSVKTLAVITLHLLNSGMDQHGQRLLKWPHEDELAGAGVSGTAALIFFGYGGSLRHLQNV